VRDVEVFMLVIGTISSSVDLNAIFDLFMNTGIFAVLFGWLFYDTRKENKNREDRLISHIEKQGKALDRITDTIERIDVRLTYIEKKVDEHKKDDKS